MNSKECLERLLKYANINEAELITKYGYSASNDIETIKQDLDKLEKLEKALNLFFCYIDTVRPLSFDTFISSECSKEEFDLILELMKKYLEELENG